MSAPRSAVRRLAPEDLSAFREMLDLLGRAFEQPETYSAAQPDDAYLRARLGDPTFTALVAEDPETGAIIGGLTAYELKKFEQARSEIFIYDLAVDVAWRRRGVATALIEAMKPIARACGAHVLVIHAERDDAPAVAVYDRLGARQEVLLFDIEV